MKKSHMAFISLGMILAVASMVLAISVNSSDAVAAEVVSQLAAGSAAHVVTTIITGLLVATAGVLWYMSFHRRHKELKDSDTSSSAKRSTSRSSAKSATASRASSTAKKGAKTTKATAARSKSTAKTAAKPRAKSASAKTSAKTTAKASAKKPARATR